MNTQPEVRYQMLRPSQVVERRTQCPVAYIPLGNLEWHGIHNPLGADTLQAEGLAILCAEKGGGLALPPLYYGESRLEALMEANAADRDKIAAEMGLPPENFLPDRQPFPAMEQALNYHKLLLHILAEAETLGFQVGVLVPGHYPLIDHARAAAIQFNKREFSRKKGMLAWACIDYLFLTEKYDYAGDHAAGWETSHLLALHPDTVDLSILPPKGEPMVGVMPKMQPQDATAAFGRKTLEESADCIVREVAHRLQNPQIYKAHGGTLLEGLWKKEAAGKQPAR